MLSPRHVSIIAAGCFAIAAHGQLFARDPKITTSARLEDLYVKMPRPEYPHEARKNGITGRGMYQVLFRPDTGVVIRVTVLESTGSKLLDQAAIKALSQWRARPRKLSRAHVPFTFTFVQ